MAQPELCKISQPNKLIKVWSAYIYINKQYCNVLTSLKAFSETKYIATTNFPVYLVNVVGFNII